MEKGAKGKLDSMLLHPTLMVRHILRPLHQQAQHDHRNSTREQMHPAISNETSKCQGHPGNDASDHSRGEYEPQS